jgi:hypothetical protein
MMLLRQLELASGRLAKAGSVALLLNVPHDGRVDRGMRGLAIALPIALLEGALDDGPAVERLFEYGRNVLHQEAEVLYVDPPSIGDGELVALKAERPGGILSAGENVCGRKALR